MKDKKKQKTLILSIVAVVTLIALVVGATYAYFKAQGGTGSSTEVKVTTYTTDMLTFTTGSAISLYADQSSFGQEKGSLSGETFAKATLVANNKTNEATDNYYVYFNIENNTFKYTLGNDKPELILTVTGPDGSEVTSLSGLTHTTVQDRENKSISGFDVTTTNGLITIANKKTITATPNAEEQYTLKLTFVNYEGDQTENTTSTLSAKVMIQKEVIPQVVSDVCTNGDNLATCITTLAGKSSASLTKIYHHDGTFKSDSEISIEYYDSETAKKAIKTYPAGTVLDANDKSYRYAGSSDQVNNYVCFGSSTTPCPEDNLYRIIGVFGEQVKLIKSDYANSNLLGTDGDYSKDIYSKVDSTSYKGKLTSVNTYYNHLESYIWGNGELNKTNLNINYITNIGEEWANKIDTATWKVGGNAFENISNEIPSLVYQNEVVNPLTPSNGETDYISKIGLMYASDYGFAAVPSAWTSTLYYYDDEAIKSANWMYMGLEEWTISPNTGGACCSFYVYSYGSVSGSVRCRHAVRPVFYFKSSVSYVEGDGTQNSPIRVGD